MRPRCGLFTVLILCCGSPVARAADPKAAFFEARVRPVLVEACVRCHGPAKASGGLRVDSRAALLKGGDSGPAVVPDKPGESLLLKAVHRDADTAAMPPDKPLAAAAVAALERWVRDGAVWPASVAPIVVAKHWAFEPVRAAEPPAGVAPNPIDAFILAKLREKTLTPVAAADKLTLIRRATFDLTGLPPTPDDIDAFIKDASAGAFRTVVDRLLASPAYGEKWGRHWLDVVRYADTAGETADFPAPEAWRYRNYVIRAFNADTPFDQFVREQVAGDLLARQLPPGAAPERYADLVTATGYLAVSRRFGHDIEADHYLTIEDTIDTLGKSILGLTVACARCHDHKYDAITAADYYALYGIFESTGYPHPGCEKIPTPRGNVPLVPTSRLTGTAGAARGLVGAAAGVKADAAVSRAFPQAYATWDGAPHDAALHKRGDPMVKGAVVRRRFLTVLGGQTLPPGAGSGRLALAGWLTDPKNPLTARVMVNRVWQGHFGTGLVATPNDFGTRGAPPTHPALLEWLAARFVADGWSVKALHRRVMLSDTYQRSAATDDANARSDPADACLWRFPRRRLTAEEIRDAMLAVSGDLDPTPGGPHPFPDAKTWRFTQHNPFAAVYDTNRRSVYLMTQRIKRHPFLTLFDGPDPNASTAGRPATTVPTQALFFLNDPFVHARADSLAAKLLTLPDAGARVERACRLLYGRPARDKDREVARRVAGTGDDRAAWATWVRVLFGSNEFVYVD